MSKKEKSYKLIIKDLTEEISDEEKQILEQMLSNDRSLKQAFMRIFSFWKHFYPNQKRHNIIEKAEKKLNL